MVARSTTLTTTSKQLPGKIFEAGSDFGQIGPAVSAAVNGRCPELRSSKKNITNLPFYYLTLDPLTIKLLDMKGFSRGSLGETDIRSFSIFVSSYD